ncbi:MAG: hypothetical protein IJ057_08925 [Bacteroidales bacterium]|nr:hypothetical protein [Bacteroidales bacterium]
MKNLLLTLLILFAITASAQEHIDFMGIPVDGIQAELFGKLKEKGFQETDDSNVLKGLFDDLPVEVLVLDNVRGKVYEMDIRHEVGNDEALAIERYNSLLLKFKNDPKYNDTYSELIPEGEPIGEKLRSDTHLYTACFTQSGKHGYVRIKLFKTNNWKDEKWYKLASFVIEIEYVNAANSPNG